MVESTRSIVEGVVSRVGSVAAQIIDQEIVTLGRIGCQRRPVAKEVDFAGQFIEADDVVEGINIRIGREQFLQQLK